MSSSIRNLVLAFLAITPILAAPLAAPHVKVAPPPPANAATKVSHTSTAHTAIATTKADKIIPSATLPTVALPTVSAASADIPPLIIPVTDESGPDAHVVPRAAELVAAVRAENAATPTTLTTLTTTATATPSPSPEPLTIPVSDESGEDAHTLQGREAATSVVAPQVAEAVSETEQATESIPPLVIETVDNNADCAENRGGCDITFAA